MKTNQVTSLSNTYIHLNKFYNYEKKSNTHIYAIFYKYFNFMSK